MTTFLEKVKAKINEELITEQLTLIDNSNLHSKHKSFDSGKFYLKLIIKSNKLKMNISCSEESFIKPSEVFVEITSKPNWQSG